MKIAKPSYLYHGSPEKLDRIEPSPARGVGPEKDRLNAVYATHIQNLAIVFSLPFEQIDDEQWISYSSVEPCDKVRINPKDFLHWLR